MTRSAFINYLDFDWLWITWNLSESCEYLIRILRLEGVPEVSSSTCNAIWLDLVSKSCWLKLCLNLIKYFILALPSFDSNYSIRLFSRQSCPRPCIFSRHIFFIFSPNWSNSIFFFFFVIINMKDKPSQHKNASLRESISMHASIIGLSKIAKKLENSNDGCKIVMEKWGFWR